MFHVIDFYLYLYELKFFSKIKYTLLCAVFDTVISLYEIIYNYCTFRLMFICTNYFTLCLIVDYASQFYCHI